MKIIYIQGNSIKLYQSFERLKTYLESFGNNLFNHKLQDIENVIYDFVKIDYEFTVGSNMIHKISVCEKEEELKDNPDYITLVIYNGVYDNTMVYFIT